jgi:hypothetical protein
MSTLSMLKFRASIFTAVLALAPLSPASHAQATGAFAKVNVPFAFEDCFRPLSRRRLHHCYGNPVHSDD